jgi:MFS family permease
MSREQQLQIPPEEVIANSPLTDRAWNGKPHRPNSWRPCLRLASGALGTKENLGRLLHLVHLLCFCTVFFYLNWNFCAGEILGGLAYGFYVVIAPTYASEICPLALRGVLTASVNLAFVIGQFIAQGCSAGLESRLGEWAYKAPFVCALGHFSNISNYESPRQF